MQHIISLITVSGTFLFCQLALDDVNITIYPEYYYAGIMVEMDAVTAAADTEHSISIIVPINTDSVFLVQSADSQRSTVEPLTLINENGTSLVQFAHKEKQFRLFVFYNPFDASQNRSFSWPIGSNWLMNNIHLSVQVPVMAQDFNLSIDATVEEREQDGLVFKTAHLGQLQGNAVKTISGFYQNFTGQTTMEIFRERLDNSSSTSQRPVVDNDPPRRHTLLLWEPVLIFGVIVTFIGLIYFGKNSRTRKEQIVSGGKFCTTCSGKLNQNDKYCANCGEKVK